MTGGQQKQHLPPHAGLKEASSRDFFQSVKLKQFPITFLNKSLRSISDSIPEPFLRFGNGIPKNVRRTK